MQVTGYRSQLSSFRTLPKDTHNEILSYFNLQDLDQIKSVNRCFHKESKEFLKKFIDGAVFLIQPKSKIISFTKKISYCEEIRYEFPLQLPNPLCDGSYSDSDSSDEDSDDQYTPLPLKKENINDVMLTSSYLGCTDAIRLLLLHKNANINFHIEKKSPLSSAVHFATYTNSFSAVKLLLQNGADVNNIQGVDGADSECPLMIAIQSKNLNLELIRLLLQNGADLNHIKKDMRGNLKNPLCTAIEKGNTKLVELLLEYHADPNQALFIFRKEIPIFKILNPLISASVLGHEEIIKILFKHGADIKQLIQKYGCDPIILASAYKDISILKLLLENGSDVNSKFNPLQVSKLRPDSIAGGTALHMAAHVGHLESCQFLIEHNSDINAKNLAGFTPFHLAIRSAVSISLHDFVTTNRIALIQYLLSFSNLKLTEFPSQFGMETLRSCIRREADRFGPDILSTIQQRLASDDQ